MRRTLRLESDPPGWRGLARRFARWLRRVATWIEIRTHRPRMQPQRTS